MSASDGIYQDTVVSPATAGQTPMPINLPARLSTFIWDVSARQQIGLATLSALVFGANVIPLEIQRRIVNDAVSAQSAATIVLLALAYLGSALALGGLKLGLNIYRSYTGENAVRLLRRLLLDHLADVPPEQLTPAVEGVEVSLVLDEAEPIGAFVGVSVSEPLLQGGLLLALFGYMVHLQPLMAVVALLVFFPQAIFVPIMQNAINHRLGSRIKILRSISVSIIVDPKQEPAFAPSQRAMVQDIYTINMEIFKIKFSMNYMMNIMQHIGVAATLALGGYYVVQGATEIGTVVVFLSGLAQLSDPWGEFVNWYRDLRVVQTRYELIVQASQTMRSKPAPQL